MWHSGKEFVGNTSREAGSIPGLGRSPIVGNDNWLQYSYLENFVFREGWGARVPGVTKCWTQVNECARAWTRGHTHTHTHTDMFPVLTAVGSNRNLRVCAHAQSCPTLCHPMDCSLPGSSVHGISQARILEYVAISSYRGFSWFRDGTHISCVFCIAGRFFTSEPSR